MTRTEYYDTPYSDPKGWAKTEYTRYRKNPRRTFYNFFWEPKYAPQELYVKTQSDGQKLYKWVSPGLEESTTL